MRRFALASLPLLALVAGVAFAGDKTLGFDTPKDWKEAASKGGTFGPIHQWELPKADGDSEAPVLKVYWFHGQGGSVDDNVKRWCGQFQTASGDAFPPEKAKKETFKANGLEITTVEIAGTYVPPAMMGGGAAKKGQKLLAAYVDGEGGPWFVKLQGGEKSVDKNKAAFVKWLKTAKLADAKK